MEYRGRFGREALFASSEVGVVMDEPTRTVVRVGDVESLIAAARWERSGPRPSESLRDLANAAVSSLDIVVLADRDRMYTIPDAVRSEAKRALKWRAEKKRGGTSVGLNTARTLAEGGQIGIRKLRHIARYFPRHEVDKKGEGYRPGEDGYPSNGRIAWGLWGGDAAQRWASRIVERENKRDRSASVVAGGGWSSRHDSYGDEFYVRIRLDGSGIDRAYRVSPDGSCLVWDDGRWDDMGNVAHDFLTYDRALDDPYDRVKKIHVPIDEESAVIVSALVDEDPMARVPVSSITPREHDLFERALPGIDWVLVDQLSTDELEEMDDLDLDDHYGDGLGEFVVRAAGEPVTDQDGNYTPEERSAKAAQQVRDQMGRFSKTGSSVVIGNNPDYTGTVIGIKGDTQEVTVKLANGDEVDVPANLTQDAAGFQPVAQTNVPSYDLNFSGILGEPRTPIDQPLARLPGRLPPLTGADTNLLMSDWSVWASAQRVTPEYEGDPMAPFVPKPPGDINSVLGEYYRGAFNPDGTIKKSAGWNPAIAPNVYNDPMLRDWLDQRYGGSLLEGGYSGAGWYREEKMSREEALSPGNVKRYDEKYSRYGYLSSVLAAAAEAAGQDGLTPETTDVPGMYLAIVADDDPQAVMELVCLIPKGEGTTAPTTFKRRPGEWVHDDKILQDLQSATPPPVIVLDNEMLAEVTKQIDGDVETITGSSGVPAFVALSDNAVIASLMAAGGLDRNRGNAERLRRYWTVGPGALKIRWNTPGDWTRCYRQLAKHMGPRAKGYCSLRHKEMTGVWPGSKYNVGKKKKRGGKPITSSLESVRSEEQVIDEFTLRARVESARSRMLGRGGARPSEHGARFSIPLVIPEGVETGDGRIFDKGAITHRDLPLPLLWQIKTGQGHDGSVVVGQILSMDRTKDGIGNAYGVFDTGEFGREAERLVRNGFIRGVSADMDMFEADEPDEAGDSGESGEGGKDRIKIRKARVMAVTIVPKPAFQECFITIVGDEPDVQDEEDSVVPDGVYVEGVNPSDASALVACGMVASSIPVEPPTSWFEDPDLGSPTPLTVTDEGRVFGHIAAWHVDHIGMSFGTKPPRSRSRYSYFHTGVLRTAEGEDVPVGQLTLAGGHAGLEASAEEAVRHYDDTASAVADVHAGEDAFGIWVAGSLRPGVTPEQVRALRASAPSGDWRPIKGNLELVAVCQVNVPGFPVARARVASGQVMALVAAGASVLAQLKSDPVAELSRKVEMLERVVTHDPLVAAAEELASRVRRVKKGIEDDDDYMNQMWDEDPEREMAVVSREIRERLAKEGKALPDGSYPIRNVADLKNAVQAYGRAKPGKRAKVRKHIIRRARGLNRADLIPEEWKSASIEIEDSVLEMRHLAELAAASIDRDGAGGGGLKALSDPRPVVAAAIADEEVVALTPEELRELKRDPGLRVINRGMESGKYTPATQPRDASGKFRLVLARLKSDLGTAGLARVVDKVEEVENLDSAGDYQKAADAADDLMGIINRIDTGALNPEALENVRSSSAELGKVIANLPFAFGEQSQKIRFSDVPPALRKLIKDMIEKVEEKVGQEDADEATAEIRSFMSGSDYYSQSEISAQMATMLRLLT